MTMAPDDVGARVCAALDELADRDMVLFQIDANERTITYRLGLYLAARFEGWDVDCEYNRDGTDPKYLGRVHDEMSQMGPYDVLTDPHARTVYPDIIVHRRGTRENLLVIELKKTSNPVPATVDVDKVKAFMNPHHLNYEYGAFVRLGHDGSHGRIERFTLWSKDGEIETENPARWER